MNKASAGISCTLLLLAAILTAAEATARTRVARRYHRVADSTYTPKSAAFSVEMLDSVLNIETKKDCENSADLNECASILGESVATSEQLAAFVGSRNPDFDPAIAQAFIEVGNRYGIRGDVALCQSILETGWFKFSGGTCVKPEQHNYCGLGVTKSGVTGISFNTIEQGVTAQIQHLYAYATKAPLPKGETLLDPRFSLVERGCAATWHDLNRRWAANDHYGERILTLYKQMLAFKAK